MPELAVALLTREFPPEVYGGAGVHVEYLSRELARRVELRVHCFGAPRQSPLVAGAYQPWQALTGPEPERAALQTVSVDLLMAAAVGDARLVHSHTWYANLAGHLAQLMYGVPHVMTSHSLEPLRPWKAEQLGGGYAVSSFCERVAVEHADGVIAVSQGMRDDVLRCYPSVQPSRVHVIHNGIDPEEYRPVRAPEEVRALGVDPERRFVLFVGRVTRQKGVPLLLEAARTLDTSAQLVVCAGAPDTPEIAAEVRALADLLRDREGGLVWIEEMLPRPQLVTLLSHATVLVCPSVYEPFGLVNLEAMACATAVVANAVGGIPEIVVDGETGYLVPCEVDATGAFVSADARQQCVRVMSERINALVTQPELAGRMGEAGRQRVLERFTWTAVAEQTVRLYQSLTG